MLDDQAIFRLKLSNFKIDCSKSFEMISPKDNKDYTVVIYLLKDSNLKCPYCSSKDLESRGSKKQNILYSIPNAQNIKILLVRKEYKCKCCGKYFKENNPFNDGKTKISYYHENEILYELKNPHMTFKDVAKRFNVSQTFVSDLFDKRVDIKRGKLTQVLCFDEVFSKKISVTKYCFIIYSPQLKKILDVLDSRRKNVLQDYFYSIPVKERESVKFVSIDLYDTYRNIASKCFKNAKICADPFHVIKNLTDAFQSIRKRVMRNYDFLKNENHNFYWLYKKFFKLLTLDPSKLSHKKFLIYKTKTYLSQKEIVEYMLSLNDDLRLAYELMHEYRIFNEKSTLDYSPIWLDELILKFYDSKIPEYISFAKLLKNWRLEIINSFNKLNNYRISNGPMERTNLDIKNLFRISFGFSNFTRARNRILYSLNDNSSILYKREEDTNKRNMPSRGEYKNNI